MMLRSVKRLRATLGVSRAEFSRFLGVSEATVFRWESDKTSSDPRGLQALLLQSLEDALASQSSSAVARIVRTCGIDHRAALREVLSLSATRTDS